MIRSALHVLLLTAGLSAQASLRVEPSTTDVRLGQPFDLTVVRSWNGDAAPAAFDDRALAPLAAKRISAQRRTDGANTIETLHYTCRAFELGTVEIGRTKVALHVRSTLGANAGPVELPRLPFAAPFRWQPWILFGALGVAALALVWWFLRRGIAGRSQRLSPEQRALAQLRTLRDGSPDGQVQLRADAVATSSILRRFVRERFGFGTPGDTTDEVVTGAAATIPEGRDDLGALLEEHDRIKFARHEPTTSERTRRLDAIEGFVRDAEQAQCES